MLHFLFSLLMSASVAVPHQNTGGERRRQGRVAEGWDSLDRGPRKAAQAWKGRTAKINRGLASNCHFPPLEIQEYLQSYARSQQWKISQEQVTEDSWTITRALSKEELLGATKRNSGMTRVTLDSWSSHLHISTAQVAEGFARTLIRANFRGYGQNADQVCASAGILGFGIQQQS